MSMTWQILWNHMMWDCFTWWLQWLPCLPWSGFHYRTSAVLCLSSRLCMTVPCMFVLTFAVDRFAERLVVGAVPVWTWPFRLLCHRLIACVSCTSAYGGFLPLQSGFQRGDQEQKENGTGNTNKKQKWLDLLKGNMKLLSKMLHARSVTPTVIDQPFELSRKDSCCDSWWLPPNGVILTWL